MYAQNPTEETDGTAGMTRKQKLIALLEMAAEAEKLGRFAQSEILYERSLLMATICFGACSAERAAVLWDLARVSELQQHKGQAQSYYGRAYAISCCGQYRQNDSAA